MGVKGVKIKGGEHFPLKTIQYYFPNFKIILMRMHLNNWLKICYMYMFKIFRIYMQLNVLKKSTTALGM